MKKPFKSNCYFLYGILFMCGVIILVQCNKNDDPLFDGYKQSELELNIDYKAINNAGKEIEQLLKDGDITSLNKLLSEESVSFYGNKQSQYSSEELEVISKAFKKRNMTSATEDFAEFTYTIDGIDYTLTIGQVEEGVWKIIRY